MERQDQNEAFIRRGYALWNAINRHRLDHPDDRVGLDRLVNELAQMHAFDEDYMSHAPGGGRGLWDGGAFPDGQMTIDELVATKNRVITRFTLCGTHRGELWGIAPTGRQVEVSGILLQRSEGGKIREDRQAYDRLDLLHRIGVISDEFGQ